MNQVTDTVHQVTEKVNQVTDKAKWRSALVAAVAGLAIIPIAGAHRPADPPAAYATLAPGHETAKKKSKRPDEDDDSLTPAQQASLNKAMAAADQLAPADPVGVGVVAPTSGGVKKGAAVPRVPRCRRARGGWGGNGPPVAVWGVRP